MNQAILRAITHLNKFMGQGYKWPSPGDGSVGDVLYQDKIILKGNSDKLTYCCGITLQAYIMACNDIGKHLGTMSDLLAIKRKWFITEPVPGPLYLNKGPVDALVPRGHGRELTLEQAEPGDLCQLWRQKGSGHSVIFLNSFIENGVRAIKYWSTQPATNGIGYRTEYFDGVQNPVTHVHICRPL